ncbi:MAG: hypothetical protein ACRENC_03350 [Gemmatimonadaceae bacterium]
MAAALLSCFGDERGRIATVEVPSADSTWIAVHHQDDCGVLAHSPIDFVDLHPSKHPTRAATVLEFSGAWSSQDDVSVRWIGSRRLEVTVPNLTLFDSLTTSYKDVQISVVYDHSDSLARAAWERKVVVEDSLSNQEMRQKSADTSR